MASTFYVISNPNADGEHDVYDSKGEHVTSAVNDESWQILPGILVSHPELTEKDIVLDYVGDLDEMRDAIAQQDA